MNKFRRDDSDTPRCQILDKLDNFWIDLNEATTMRPEAKAQIYSVKKTYQQTKSLKCEGVLDQLERTHEKEKKVKLLTEK